MNLEEMDAAVAQRYAESVSTPVFFTAVDRKRAIAEGLMVLGDLTEYKELEVPIRLIARQTYYDLRGYGESPILSVFSVFADGPVRWLRSTSVRELDGEVHAHSLQYYPRWEDIEAEPKAFFMRSLYWMGLYPRVSTDGEIAKLLASCLPLPLVNDEDEPDGLLDEFQEALIEYALYVLFTQDRESTLALEHYSAFESIEQAVRDWVQERQRLDWTVTAGEEADID